MATAKCPLKITISGAGIAGLSCAIALARSGHSVKVFESKKEISEIGAGIQIHPNSSRILQSWGLGDVLGEASEATSSIEVRRYATGELLRVIKAGGEFGFPTWLIYRPDLIKILHEHALSAGVEVRLGSAVAEEHLHDIDSADLVLIAEGIGSKHRKIIVPDEEVIPRINMNAYRFMVPRDKMMQDADTAALITSGVRQLWLGPGRNVVAYPISRGRFYNLVLEHPGQAEPGVWNKPADLTAVKAEFHDFEPLVQKLMGLATETMDWCLARLPPLHRWMDDMGRLLLIGDAAHATTPQLAQGAGMCFEDAAVLSECMAQMSTKSDLAQATNAFFQIRKDRVTRVQDASWQNSKMFTMPDGPQQQKRDEEWKANMNKASPAWTSEFFKWLYGHDAISEARAYLEKNPLTAADDPNRALLTAEL